MAIEIKSGAIGFQSLPRRTVAATLAGAMLAMFLSSLSQTIVSIATPRIIGDLGGFSQYTWLTTAYMITSAVAVPITGKLTDMYGRKFFYIAGLGIFVAASFLCGRSNTMTQIIISRGIQGVGAGIMMSNAFTVIGDLFPPAERGKYQGFMSGVMGLSSIIGPTIGGFITDTLSWRWVFFVNIPLGIVIIILFILFFPHFRPDDLKHSVDYPGLAVFIPAVMTAMLALSWAGVEYPWNSPQIALMFSFSALMLALFVFIENRSKEPIIPLSLFKNRIVSVSVPLFFFTGFGMFGGITFVPLFFQGVLGATATTSGSFLTPMMLGVVVGSFISGQVLSRTGGHYRLQGAIGLAITGLGLALLSRMTIETSYASAVVNIVVTGLGTGITMPLYTIAVQNAVPYNLLGVATSATTFFRSIGGSVGLAILGSAMNNQFASEFIKRLPAEIKASIPPERLMSLVRNPQVLVNPAAQAQLEDSLAQLGSQGAMLYQQVLQTLRLALDSALSRVFLIGVLVLIVAFVINFFIKEIPLRRQHRLTDLTLEQKPKE